MQTLYIFDLILLLIKVHQLTSSTVYPEFSVFIFQEVVIDSCQSLSACQINPHPQKFPTLPGRIPLFAGLTEAELATPLGCGEIVQLYLMVCGCCSTTAIDLCRMCSVIHADRRGDYNDSSPQVNCINAKKFARKYK